jgi:hypothetical protein
MKKIFLLPLMLVMAVLLSSCGGFSVPSDQVAVQEGRGWESKKVKGCKAPNERDLWGNDAYFQFPTNEREWVAVQGGTSAGGDSGRFDIVSKDSVPMWAPVTLQFNMITDCKTLIEFWTKHGRRNQAYFDEDGNYTDGWMNVLKKLVASPADATLDRIAQKYNWREMWNDPAIKVQIEKELQEAVNADNSLLVQRAQGKYFEDFSVVIGKFEPVNQELATAVALEQTNVAKAQSAEAQAKADEAKARAEIAVNEAEAAKKRATIEGFKLQGMTAKEALDAYLESLRIEAGLNSE